MFLKFVHDAPSIGLLLPGGILICRVCTELGSHLVSPGVSSELRFCVIESSIVARDRRRKSRSCVELKQNCGVNAGGSYDLGGMSSLPALRFGGGDDDGEVVDEGEEGVLFQNQEAVMDSARY